MQSIRGDSGMGYYYEIKIEVLDNQGINMVKTGKNLKNKIEAAGYTYGRTFGSKFTNIFGG